MSVEDAEKMMSKFRTAVSLRSRSMKQVTVLIVLYIPKASTCCVVLLPPCATLKQMELHPLKTVTFHVSSNVPRQNTASKSDILNAQLQYRVRTMNVDVIDFLVTFVCPSPSYLNSESDRTFDDSDLWCVKSASIRTLVLAGSALSSYCLIGSSR